MSSKSLFINGWPDSVRPLDEFLSSYKDVVIIVCTATLANNFIRQGWECLVVSSHTIEAYAAELIPKLRGRKIFSIIADSELHIQPAAYLREELNVQGQGLKSAECFRNKREMINCLTHAKTFIVPLTLISSTTPDIKNKINPEKKYIIKPISGTDSFEVDKISGLELQTKIALIPEGTLIQEFIDYPVYHIDGVVSNGELIFYCVSKYDSTCLEYAKSESLVLGSNIVYDKDIISRFGPVIMETLSLMPTPENTTFHSEFFYDDDSEKIYFCEIASRSPGGSGTLVKMIEYVYAVNLPYEMVARNMPFYVENNNSYGLQRNDGRTASTMFIPLSLVQSLPDIIPENVIYYHGPNGKEPASTNQFRTTDDAIKIVFTANSTDLIDEKKNVMSLFN